MNKQQRTAIEKIKEKLSALTSELEDIKSEEESKFDNMPENLQGSEKGEALQSGIDTLDSIISNLQEADSNLDTVIES